MKLLPSHRPVSLAPIRVRGRLFRKYVGLFVAVVATALAANSLVEIWFSYREQSAALARVQRSQAEEAAARIDQFVKNIEGQMGWLIQFPWSADNLDEWRFDAVRLLRQVPAITELARLDPSGHEEVRISRVSQDVIGSQTDYPQHPKFVEAMTNRHY